MKDLWSIIERTSRLLKLQIQLGSNEENLHFEERFLSDFFLGYVFGFCCAAMGNLNNPDMTARQFIMEEIYTQTFGPEGPGLLRRSMIMDSDEFRESNILGWREQKQSSETAGRVLGLADYLKHDRLTVINRADKLN